jgi:hypothetical protein
MRIYLAATGWINDAQPHGNRLRWSYPCATRIKPDKYVGLPETIIIERASLDEDLWTRSPVQTAQGTISPSAVAIAPISWWSPPINLQLSDWFVIYRLPAPVQAVRFTYRGPKTQVRVKDTANNRLVADLPIANNEHFYLEAPLIDEISFIPLASTVYLDNFSTLDLFQDRGLKWQMIATLSVIEVLKRGATLDTVLPRCGGKSTLTNGQWNEFMELASKAQTSIPATAPPEPVDMLAQPPQEKVEAMPPWQTFDMVIGLRWEFACMFGFGYYDGPRADVSPLDRIDERLALDRVPHKPVAYRVRSEDRRVEASNIVVCPPYPAPPLATPGAPKYHNTVVRLKGDQSLEASIVMEWQQFDARAIGVEIEQQVSASPAKGTPTRSDSFLCRSSHPDDPPYTGRLTRLFNVPWHDVTLRARARACDAWDRTSGFSAWSTAAGLTLEHTAFPPPLLEAKYNKGIVTITRQPANQEVPDWQPDPIVRVAKGKVCIYRRDPGKKPQAESVTVSAPEWVEGNLYRAKITVSNPSAFTSQVFEGGTLTIGQARLRIAKLSGFYVYFSLPEDSSQYASAYSPGAGTLYQDLKDVSLWVKVHEELAEGLPSVLQFSEPLPPPTDKADVLSYYARVLYLGRLGPPSNIVADFRVPPVPSVPPPFTVELQGVDFYGRTLVKIKLTKPVSGGQYRIWWAPGDYSKDAQSFSQKAVAGLYGPQSAQNTRFLYDLLALPLDKETGQPLSPITIGVQQVNQSGGQSQFQVVKL